MAYSKSKIPTCLLAEYRLPIYKIGRHQRGCENFETDTKYGGFTLMPTEEISSHSVLPTARHRDVLDAVHACAKEAFIDGARQLVIVFDDADVRSLLGRDFKWRDIYQYLSALVGVRLRIWKSGCEATTSTDTFTILARIRVSDKPAKRKPGQYPANTKMIVYSAGFVENMLFNEPTLRVNKDVIRKTLALTNQVSRSCVRWLLSHKGDQHHNADDVLRYVGFDSSDRQLRDYLKQLKDDAVAMKDLKIELVDGVFHTKRHPGVFFNKGIGSV